MASPARHDPYSLSSARRLAPCLILLLAACADDPATTALGPVADRVEAISDGGHDGNEHFFFMQPLVPELTYTGDFDPTYAAEVRICAWDGTACVGADIAHFTTMSGTGSEIIRIDPVAQHYSVKWHTNRANDGAGLDPTKTYRIIVSSDGYELGHADLDVVATGRELKNVETDEFVALKDGGTLVIRFRIEVGAVPAEDKATVATGDYHSCALDDTGAAWCWGSNYYGQLGMGTTTWAEASPVVVAGGHQFTEIHARGLGTCALDVDGAAWCWGFRDGPAPAAAAPGHTFLAITRGLDHACGVSTSGAAYCWGDGHVGQLGNGAYDDWSGPVLVGGGTQFAALSAGAYHTCGVTVDDAVLCWGFNWYGQLGRGFATHSHPYGSATPAPAMAGLGLVDVSAGGYHTCGLTATGGAHCVGYNLDGQLGGGFHTDWEVDPAAVTGARTFTALAPGTYHTCGIDAAGDGWCWGSNTNGQLGRGSWGGAYASPQAVVGMDTWAELVVGGFHTCGVTTSDAVRCWGYNGFGQVGDGDATFVPSPTDVAGLP